MKKDLRVMRREAVKARVGLSTPSLYRLMAQGRFPRPIPLGGGLAVGWLEHEIQKWLEQRVAERDARGGRDAA